MKFQNLIGVVSGLQEERCLKEYPSHLYLQDSNRFHVLKTEDQSSTDISDSTDIPDRPRHNRIALGLECILRENILISQCIETVLLSLLCVPPRQSGGRTILKMEGLQSESYGISPSGGRSRQHVT